jgi:outer membrane lipoprotein-sorting protein
MPALWKNSRNRVRLFWLFSLVVAWFGCLTPAAIPADESNSGITSPRPDDSNPSGVSRTPEEIVRKADDIMDAGEYTANLTMTVQRKGDEDRVYKMTLFCAGAEKLLVTFDFPPRDKGQAYLRVGDQMWLYLPKVNKTMRVPKQQAFAGGDFSNHDVLNIRLLEEYVPSLDGEETVEGVPCHRLILKAREKSAAYATIRYWVARDTMWPVKREFMTVGGKAFKTLILKATHRKDRPDTFIMSNIMEKDRITTMISENLQSMKHNPMIFTESSLIRRR